ncbi:MAG: tetratricopeptide repeat protein [Clostridiales bacterium]|nr:tetratricopeptide repeat protein [Clostridiales bacterium]
MNVQEIFGILGIEETRDEDEIRAAYRKLLLTSNPEDDAEGFKRLRRAYEEAVGYARTPADEEIQSAGWMEESGPEGIFLRQLADIYTSLPRRLDPAEWDSLLREPVLGSVDSGEPAKWAMFSYLSEHFRLPVKIWKMLDRTFLIEKNHQEFREHLPEGFVDFMLERLDTDDGREFPMDRLQGDTQADYDGFISALFTLRNKEKPGTPEELEERGRALLHLASLGIDHPWYGVEQAEYLALTGKTEEAAGMVRSLIMENREDEQVYMPVVSILISCGCRTEARGLYAAYLCGKRRTSDGAYQALMGLARLDAEDGNWEKAREHVWNAGKLEHTEEARRLLGQADQEIIRLYTSRTEGLNQEEALLLARCFVHSEQGGEGRRFFEAHPEYIADTPDFHEQMAMLNMLDGRSGEALEEIGLWRMRLKQENVGQENVDQKSGSQEAGGQKADSQENGIQKASQARSFHVEGRVWRDLYHQEIRREGGNREQAAGFSDRALAAHSQAVLLEPDNVDYRLYKVMVLRDRQDYQEMEKQCREILQMDDGVYWAIFSLQEAGERLGKDQEVVDAYLRAREIYDGHPEIYIRAVRVFKAYGKYENALRVIDDAGQAGVNSSELLVERIGVLDRLAKDAEDWRRADRYAAAVIRHLEQNKESRELLADAYLKRAFLNDSGNQFNKYKKLGLDCRYAEISLRLRESLSARYALGRYWIEYGNRPKQAYLHLKQCEKQGMDYERLYYYIARCHERFREWNKAIGYYDKALQKNPESSNCYWRLSVLYKQKYTRTLQNEYGEKALYYTNLLEEKFGPGAENFRRRADIYLHMKEYDKALKEIEQGIEMDGDSGMWLLKGKILRVLGRYEEAIACCGKSLEASDQFGADEEECFKRVFQCFLRMKQIDQGIEYFTKALDRNLTADGREKCLENLMDLEAEAGRHDKALGWIREQYGSTDLDKRCCDDWEEEGKRIEAVLNIWLKFRKNPSGEIWDKCREAEGIAREALADEAGDKEGRALVCQNVGEAWYYLGNLDKALDYLSRAYDIASWMKKYGYYRSLTKMLIRTHYWRNDLKEARKFGDLYRARLESDYTECSDLGLSMEELLTRPTTESRQVLYNLFCWSYFTGRHDEAREYFRLMDEERGMCWWCDEDGCTELLEARGFLLMLDHKKEEALMAFAQADQVIWLGCNKDARMAVKMLEKETCIQ